MSDKTTADAFVELLEIVNEGYPYLPEKLQLRVDRYAIEMSAALAEVGIRLEERKEEDERR